MQGLSPEKLQQIYQAFPDQFESVILGTTSLDSQPQASYSPCIVDEAKNIYIFVSGLSAHTDNLTTTQKASALFIEDESKTTQMFARKRLSYSCIVTLLDRDSEQWGAIAQAFETRFSNIIDLMKGLPDFRIFQLQPRSGRFVLGFGKAYDIDPNNLDQLIHKGES
ncbi:pyridoxamine 5'-phosphate oxidase family protein [Synechococcus sp. PCC 7335]|uniref:HugZ family pyridoxamine 5'-phosphate oxidase n=1 Tax=Synechococcus sp. (strain ATCC 29403 / PCC 7335) TaxID=91464 RepID=UPI00017EB8C6|nr:pyridoxamine 5'-phosphate oxidase family protein [Synechococcus sp. PCC 7335]EDX87227.1 pyridoxamine 5'-phosphate oxidase family protein [Synechococcus sp. PCC 7335]